VYVLLLLLLSLWSVVMSGSQLIICQPPSPTNQTNQTNQTNPPRPLIHPAHPIRSQPLLNAAKLGAAGAGAAAVPDGQAGVV